MGSNKQNLVAEQVQKILSENEQRRAAVLLEKSFRDIVGGDIHALEDDNAVDNLAHFMYSLYEDGEVEIVILALDVLGEGSCNPKQNIRERSIMVISIFIGITMREKDDFFIQKLSEILVRWLKKENKFIAGFEMVNQQLQQQLQWLLDEKKWHESEKLLIVLHQIATGIIKKNTVITRVVRRVQNQLASDDRIGELLDTYLDPYTEMRGITESILVHLGKKSLSCIVNRLTVEEKRDNRFRLLVLIPSSQEVFEILQELLKKEQPWYVVRNSILLLSRINNNESYEIIDSYASHSDIRVQQQVINATWKMGGTQLKSRLVKLLPSINDELKASLVVQLGQIKGDEEIGRGLVNMLDHRETLPEWVREDTLLKLAENLAHFPFIDAKESLNDLVEERLRLYGENDRVVHVAKTSIKVLEKTAELTSLRNISLEDQEVDEDSQFDDDSDLLKQTEDSVEDDGEVLTLDFLEEDVPGGSFMEDLTQDEELDDELFDFMDEDDEQNDDSDVDDAFQEILAGTQDRVNKFAALNELELENAEDHLSVWSDFYYTLDSDEFNVFYRLLKKKEYEPGEVLVKEDSDDQKLFFIDSGSIDIISEKKADRVHLKQLQSGNMIGSSSFFGAKKWTFLLVAQEQVTCHVLDRSQCQEELEVADNVIKKLELYCKSHDVISWLVEMLQLEEPQAYTVKVLNMNKQLTTIENSEDEKNAGFCFGVMKGGLCIELPVQVTDKNEDLNGLLVEVLLCDMDEKCEKIYGVVSGWQRSEQDDKLVKMLVKYYYPYRTDKYTCNALTFL